MTAKSSTFETPIRNNHWVDKDSLQIECLGTIDELQAQLGLLRVALCEIHDNSEGQLIGIQHDLVRLGSMLAHPQPLDQTSTSDLLAHHAERLNAQAKNWSQELPEISTFLLPGSGRLSALAHVARTASRRCERVMCALDRTKPAPKSLHTYMNRLSYFLFILGRKLAQRHEHPETLFEEDFL